MFWIEKTLLEVSGMRAFRGTRESEQVTSVINGVCAALKLSKYSDGCDLVNSSLPSIIRVIISCTLIMLIFRLFQSNASDVAQKKSIGT